jgi:hypothetical protein
VLARPNLWHKNIKKLAEDIEAVKVKAKSL